uniref:Protein phosphatase n=1 Tax=Gonium pectorale TaxID=33097 RepID=A0A140JWV2_GONPE|nr:serine/threonine phosphatase, family 2C [Gonium pectorale]
MFGLCYRTTTAAHSSGGYRPINGNRVVPATQWPRDGRLRSSTSAPWSLDQAYPTTGSTGLLQPRRCLADDGLAGGAAVESAAARGIVTATLPNGGGANPESSVRFALSAGAYVLPHPDKMEKGGEDWYFVAKHRRAVGVADGVGGWSEVGVDAGAYARQLMGNAEAAAEEFAAASDQSSADQPELSPQDILESAYQMTTARGSATACVAVVNGNSLSVSNLGDSGLLVLRGGAVAFHTPQQQHGFNFPYQIGSADSMSDSPSSAQRFVVALQQGDLIVLGTDGLWDNCFDEEVASVLKYCGDRSMDVAKMAQVLAHYARHRASDSKFASPFAYAAFQAGYAYMGGKMDDITVIVCQAEALP